ncbi:extended synaptotagmin-1 [Ambystoma mexicanum]|uniref:extended synaptotagmin-1 n=1 Tax=Ambystoma mexicanum TaxID=8296 RepID=UPI0037E95710
MKKQQQSRRELDTQRRSEMPGDQPQSSRRAGPHQQPSENGLYNLLLLLARTVLLLAPVYMAGYFNLSLAVVLAGLFGYVCWKHRRSGKERRLKAAMQLLEGEEEAVLASVSPGAVLRGLPAWISFSNTEKAEWLNKILLQMWPVFGEYMEKLMKSNIAAIVRASNNHLQSFSFTKVDFGTKPLKILGVQIQPTDKDKEQIILDLHLSFASDMEINCEVRKFFATFGLKGLKLHGTLRIILEPLIGDMPLVGAMTMFFIRRPSLDVNWTGLTNLLEIPGLNAMSDTMVMDIIAWVMVLPNRLTIGLINDIHLAELRCPLPRGIVRIHLEEASNLPRKDLRVKGLVSGKSDPYALVRVGTQTFTSKTINNEINPKWKEMYEAIVHEVPGQELEVEVFDKDPDKDDFMGRMKLDLGEVKKARVLDKWYSLEEAESGKVHIRLEWLALMSNSSKLEEVLNANKEIAVKTHEEPSSAFLAIYLQKAEDLPAKKFGKDPNPMVQFSVHDVTKESTNIQGTRSPVWEQPFSFFVGNPQSQDLDIQVKDEDREVNLGSLKIPLSRLLSAEHMTLDQAFQLENSGSGSRIYMKLVLRILFLDASYMLSNPSPKSASVTPEKEQPVGSTGAIVDEQPLPTITSPNENFGTERALRIHLVEAESLIAKDNFMKGLVKGASDPYAVVQVGGKTLRSRVIKENLNPRWNEMYEVIVNNIPGQEVAVEVFDKDIDKDDFLGRFKVSLAKILKAKFMDEWIPLEDVSSGKVHLRIEVLATSLSADSLEQVLLVNSVTQPKDSEELSSAMLAVYLEKAVSLPMRKEKKLPNSYAELSVKKQHFKTKICSQTISPVWDETFTFLIKNPYTETLDLQVKDDTRTLGSMSLPLSDLLKANGLTLDRWVQLQNSGLDSQILMKAQLMILSSTHLMPEVGALNLDSVLQPREKDPVNQDLRQRNTATSSIPGTLESSQGEIHLTIYVIPQEKKLVVVVHACRNLRLASKELPDPYVSMVLQPDKNRITKKKTAVKKKTLNPEYKEKFEWDMSLEEVRKKQLELSVKNNSTSFMSRESNMIGKVYIDLLQTDPSKGLTQWFELIEEKEGI